MKTDEIKNSWKEESNRISNNIKVNREVSFQKLRSSLTKIRIRRLLHLIQMSVVLPLLFVLLVFPRLRNDGTNLFYIALISFISLIVILFIYHVYYYICLLKIDFSESMLKAQKEMIRLERLDYKLYWLRFINIPVILLCVFKIFAIPLKQHVIIMIILVALVMIISTVIKFKKTGFKEYNAIKYYLDEIESEEKEQGTF